MEQRKISVLMPVYNGVPEVQEALQSIFNQDYDNYEIVISDNCSTDQLKQVVEAFRDSRIKYFRNERNFGYGPNLELARQRAANDTEVLFLMGHDDILAEGVLSEVNTLFHRYPEVGALTRGFFQFVDMVNHPVRVWEPYTEGTDRVLRLADGIANPEALFRTIYQLSGLAFRVKFMSLPFHPDVMPAQAYPFFQIMRDHPVICVGRYTVAVRRNTSQARRYSAIYEVSPTRSWMRMVQTVFPEERYAEVRHVFITYLAQNFVGLVQIKNFSTIKNLLREYVIMIRAYWPNIFQPLFWFYVVLTLCVPRRFLLRLADWHKERVMKRHVKRRQVFFKSAL